MFIPASAFILNNRNLYIYLCSDGMNVKEIR